MAKSKSKGAKRATYRAEIEKRLAGFGYRKTSYQWQDRPSQLLVIIGDGFRPFPLGAGKSQKATEFEMGRLSVWAELQRLTPQTSAAPVKRINQPTSVQQQIDLEALLAPDQRGGMHSGTSA